MTRDIQITEKLENAEAITNNFTDEAPTKLRASFTLSDGNPLNPSEFKLQLSTDENFDTLEKINISRLDVVDEVTLNVTDSFWEFKNLTPGKKYYYRIYIKNSEQETYSNVSDGTTYGLKDVGDLLVGNSVYGSDAMFMAMTKENDLNDDFLYEDYPSFSKLEFATDSDFDNMIEPLMVGHIMDNYYREAGSNIYVRSTLTFKDKTHTFVKSIDTKENIIARFSDDSYLKSNITEAKKNQKTIYLGDTNGEHIAIYNVPGTLDEIKEYPIISDKEGPSDFYIKYYDKEGEVHSVRSVTEAKLNIYRIDDSGNMFARITGYVGFKNSKSLDNCVFKAKLN